jgi:plasmid maintenance system antidote protein VapI
MIAKYGVEHPLQNKYIANKAFNNSYVSKPYILPSGKQIKYQGYENFALNEIINKHRGITADSALTLAEAFQTEPEFWLNLQSNWDLWHSLKKHRKVKPLNLNRRAA